MSKDLIVPNHSRPVSGSNFSVFVFDKYIHFLSVAKTSLQLPITLPFSPPTRWTYGSSKDLEGKDLSPKLIFDLLREGEIPSEVLEEMNKIKKDMPELELQAEILGRTNQRRRYFSEDSGSEVSIDRAISGDSASWLSTKRDRRSMCVRLGVHCSLPGMRAPEEFVPLCATLLLVIEILCSQGFGVEIFGLFTGHHSIHGTVGHVVCLKGSDEYLDVSKLCCFAFPGLHRTIMLSMLETSGITWPYRDNSITPCNELLQQLGINNLLSNNIKYKEIPEWLNKVCG